MNLIKLITHWRDEAFNIGHNGNGNKAVALRSCANELESNLKEFENEIQDKVYVAAIQLLRRIPGNFDDIGISMKISELTIEYLRATGYLLPEEVKDCPNGCPKNGPHKFSCEKAGEPR